MKLVSFIYDESEQLGILVDGMVYRMEHLHPELPHNMSMFLHYWDSYFPMAAAGELMVREGRVPGERGIPVEQLQLLAPVPFPPSCRDGYAFRQHVATARQNRNAEMIPQFDQYPVFYFTNHLSIQGPGNVYCMPDHFEKLDFELEAAVVISRQGRNIRAEQADDYIGGLMIMNDFSARRLQLEEMLLNLGPAKGKDFATATGPWLVTPDELRHLETEPKPGHTGKAWNLTMRCRVNDKEVSLGNLGDMDWTFAELVERASYGVTLHPGDIIGSGTVGTGCFLELNGTGKRQDASFQETWLQEGDRIELEIDGLGILQNTIVREQDDLSLLQLKKNI